MGRVYAGRISVMSIIYIYIYLSICEKVLESDIYITLVDGGRIDTITSCTKSTTTLTHILISSARDY